MDLRIVRHVVWLVAALALGYAAFAYWEWRRAEFFIAAGLFVACLVADSVLKAVAYQRQLQRGTPFGPVAKWGLSEDAMHARRIRTGRPSARSWWQKFTHPLIIAALPLALIPAGLLTSAPADADPLQDYAYISTLDQFGVYYTDEAVMVDIGESICDALDSGVSISKIVHAGIASGYTRLDIEHIVGAAIGAYCGEHLGGGYITGSMGGALL